MENSIWSQKLDEVKSVLSYSNGRYDAYLVHTSPEMCSIKVFRTDGVKLITGVCIETLSKLRNSNIYISSITLTSDRNLAIFLQIFL